MPAMVSVVAEAASAPTPVPAAAAQVAAMDEPALAPAAAAQADASPNSAMDEFMLPTEEDLLYEEELLRNPYSLKMWTRYIDARQGVAERRRHVLFERALKALPGSYKVQRTAHRIWLTTSLTSMKGC